jgi:hypothetical protein
MFLFLASTTLLEKKKFLLVSSLAACGFKFKGSAALIVVLMNGHRSYQGGLAEALSTVQEGSKDGKDSARAADKGGTLHRQACLCEVAPAKCETPRSNLSMNTYLHLSLENL